MEWYSMDLRERVVRACDAGEESRQEIAARYGVSVSWVRRLLQRRRETGSFAARARGRGPKPKISGARQDRLKRLVEEHPDATLEELRRRMRLQCSLSTMHEAVKRLGVTFKKSRSVRASKIEKT
jgi:transposase